MFLKKDRKKMVREASRSCFFFFKGETCLLNLEVSVLSTSTHSILAMRFNAAAVRAVHQRWASCTTTVIAQIPFAAKGIIFFACLNLDGSVDNQPFVDRGLPGRF